MKISIRTCILNLLKQLNVCFFVSRWLSTVYCNFVPFHRIIAHYCELYSSWRVFIVKLDACRSYPASRTGIYRHQKSFRRSGCSVYIIIICVWLASNSVPALLCVMKLPLYLLKLLAVLNWLNYFSLFFGWWIHQTCLFPPMPLSMLWIIRAIWVILLTRTFSSYTLEVFLNFIFNRRLDLLLEDYAEPMHDWLRADSTTNRDASQVHTDFSSRCVVWSSGIVPPFSIPPPFSNPQLTNFLVSTKEGISYHQQSSQQPIWTVSAKTNFANSSH